MSHIKVEGSQNLYRDEDSSAIINTDTTALSRAKLLKSRILSQDRERNTLTE